MKSIIFLATDKIKLDPPPIQANNVMGGINQIFFWAGVVAIVAIVLSGIKYSTSLGDPNKVVVAKTAVIYSVIGLLLVLLSFTIVNIISGAF